MPKPASLDYDTRESRELVTVVYDPVLFILFIRFKSPLRYN